MFVPHEMMSQLVASGWPQANVPLNELGKDAVSELRKTQQKILQSPWRYERAAAYIETLIAEAGTPSTSTTAHHCHA